MDKLKSRSDRCLFVGYQEMTIGYYFYNSNKQKVFVSKNAIFLKEQYYINESRTSLELQKEIEEATPKINMNNERQLTPSHPLSLFIHKNLDIVKGSLGLPKNCHY